MHNLIQLNSFNANILKALGPLPIYLLIFVIIYFIMIRPQAKQQKEHSAMLENLKKGDKIVTKGGVIGTIGAIKGKKKEIVEISSNNMKIDVLKSYITSIYNK
jgi:preprotein translocase subunit YajC